MVYLALDFISTCHILVTKLVYHYLYLYDCKGFDNQIYSQSIATFFLIE